jgi:hypothetical protein
MIYANYSLASLIDILYEIINYNIVMQVHII